MFELPASAASSILVSLQATSVKTLINRIKRAHFVALNKCLNIQLSSKLNRVFEANIYRGTRSSF